MGYTNFPALIKTVCIIFGIMCLAKAIQMQNSICPEDLEVAEADKTIRINPRSVDAMVFAEQALILLPNLMSSKFTFKLHSILSAAIKYEEDELYILRFLMYETLCPTNNYFPGCERNEPPERVEYECCVQIEYLPWKYQTGSMVEKECQMIR